MENTNIMNNENTNTMNEKEGTNTMNEIKIENNATMIEAVETYEKKTSQGYDVISLNYNFSAYSILKRETVNPYIVAYDYNVTTGTWGQGFYDFETLFDCHKFIINRTTDKDETTFYCVDFELTQGVKCKAYIEASYNAIIEYFENIDEAKNINPVIVMDEELEQNEALKNMFTRIYNRDELIEQLTDLLNGDSDLFSYCVDALIFEGVAYEDYQLFDMYDLDNELSDKTPTEIIEISQGFDTSDDYFRYDGYDLESISDKADYYTDNISVDDLVNEIIENYNGTIRREISNNYGSSDLVDLLDKIDACNC